MKIPKRLKRETACFYELGDELTQTELTQYELLYRAMYPGCFHSRSGRRYFFQLTTSLERDVFLNSIEAMGKNQGLILVRQTAYQ